MMKIKWLIQKFRKRLYVVWPLVALMLLGIVLYWERMGIKMTDMSEGLQQVWLSEPTQMVYQEADTLLLTDTSDAVSEALRTEMAFILDSMCVSYEVKDVHSFLMEELYFYDKLIICFPNLNAVGEDIGVLIHWVKDGGSMMNVQTYYTDENFQVMSEKLGIIEGGNAYAAVSGLDVADEFMVGAALRDFYFEEAYEFSHKVLLDEKCTTYIRSVDSGLPILWKCPYGKGSFVVMNQALTGKVARGFLAAAYSLMDTISVYPVIDSSVFYLDDFPAPVPSGNGKYIQQEYGLDISNFYANVWWRDVLQWEEKYGIVHTGMIIEDYSDLVNAPFPRTEAVERFRFFGNMLLNAGGELGFHGYNHMPLCLTGFDYMGLYDEYNLWESREEMSQALLELYDFSSELFPQCTFQVYVPPSNILSLEGRAILLETFPDIKAIASNYLPGDCGYEQEFEIAQDGIAEMPRITSGLIMDDYTYLMTVSELNFHYVQSHFTHPDDVLDEDRGASLGWQKLKENFEAYLDFVYQAAPNIEDMTASEMIQAIKIYDTMSLRRVENDNGVSFDIGGFMGKATFMVRVNAGGELIATGATIEPLVGDLYLLHATDSHVDLEFCN